LDKLHKTVNVLDKLPKSRHSNAKSALHEISQADSRASAEKAFDRFVAKPPESCKPVHQI
jgi:transposase-like protein